VHSAPLRQLWFRHWQTLLASATRRNPAAKRAVWENIKQLMSQLGIDLG
jgi:hypothetical protein